MVECLLLTRLAAFWLVFPIKPTLQRAIMGFKSPIKPLKTAYPNPIILFPSKLLGFIQCHHVKPRRLLIKLYC